MSVAVETFYGQDQHRTPYLTRVTLAAFRSAWELVLHVFHRGDADPDPHDHTRAFVTFPLVSYVEHVFDPETAQEWLQVVRAGRFHYRPATYCHRVLAPWDGRGEERFALIPQQGLREGRVMPGLADGGIVTLVLWLGRTKRAWGFWAADGRSWWERVPPWTPRAFTPWRDYVYRDRADG